MASVRSLSTLFAKLRRNLLWLLIAAYALAAIWPGPGDWLRALPIGDLPFTGHPLSWTHLLLGVLLFCVGVAIRPEESRSLWRLSRGLGWGLSGSWLVPVAGLVLMLLLGHFGPEGRPWHAFLVGATLVAAMPPANSSSFWSEISGGHVATTVSILILGTLLSPILSPAILWGFSLLCGPMAVARSERFAMLEVLVAFVVLPTGLGLGVRSLCESLASRWLPLLLAGSRFASLGALLLLNYTNASAAAPQLATDTAPDAATVSCLSLLYCATVFGVAMWLSRWVEGDHLGRRAGFTYVACMKNTGAALQFATTLLAQEPLAILVPVFYTIAQHLAAAATDRWLEPDTRVIPEASQRDAPQPVTPSY